MWLTYARVSTAEQAANGATSLASQKERTWLLAQAQGARTPYDVQHFEDTGVSGSIPLIHRPAGNKLFDYAKAGDTIIVTKLDRMFRSAADALGTIKSFKGRQVDVILGDISSDPLSKTQTGQLLLTIMSGVAEFERERILERVMEGRRVKRKHGGFVGGAAPYGFRVVGVGRDAKLEQEPQEQEIIALANMLSHTHSSNYHAVRELNRLGHRNRAGSPFQMVQFMKMIRKAA